MRERLRFIHCRKTPPSTLIPMHSSAYQSMPERKPQLYLSSFEHDSILDSLDFHQYINIIYMLSQAALRIFYSVTFTDWINGVRGSEVVRVRYLVCISRISLIDYVLLSSLWWGSGIYMICGVEVK